MRECVPSPAFPANSSPFPLEILLRRPLQPKPVPVDQGAFLSARPALDPALRRDGVARQAKRLAPDELDWPSAERITPERAAVVFADALFERGRRVTPV